MRQLVLFISGLVNAGKAMPILMGRRSPETDEILPAASCAFNVRQTLNLITQAANRDGALPANVTLFPRPDRGARDETPDLIA